MFGKILFGSIGFGLGMFFGNAMWALVLANAGIAIGHFAMDRAIPGPRSERPPSKADLEAGSKREGPNAPVMKRVPAPPPKPAPHDALARALCPIFIEVARADGAVAQDEVRVMREFFTHVLQFDDADLELVRTELKDSINHVVRDLDVLVREVRTHIAPGKRPLVMDALYEMALVDGQLNKLEHDALKRVAHNFNLSEEQLRKVTEARLGSSEPHYDVLGLDPTVTDEELKSTYRKLALQYHPDRILGLEPEAAEVAQDQFRAITRAYEELKKRRGL